MTDLINFDGMASSTVNPIVQESIASWISTNSMPASLHPMGELSSNLHNNTKTAISEYFGTTPEDVVFTSGTLESDNIAIHGMAQLRKRKFSKIAILSTDPLSIIQPARVLEKQGWAVNIIPVDDFGIVNLSTIGSFVDNQTGVVCCHLVNEETGALQPISEFSRIVKEISPRALIHCNAKAAFGRVEFSISELGVDSISIEPQSIGGPAGIGALITSQGIRIPPLMLGGGGSGTRPGVISNALISGFAKTLEVDMISAKTNETILSVFEQTDLGNCCWTVDPKNSAPGVVNLCLESVAAEPFVIECGINGVLISPSSGCTSSTGGPSHVLSAMGISEKNALCSIRISLSENLEFEQIVEGFSRMFKSFQNLTS